MDKLMSRRTTYFYAFFQCYTHRYLGWKINVLDSCDTEASGSNPVPSIVKAPADFFEKYSENFDEEAQESVAHSTRVKPEYGSKNGFGLEKNNTRVVNEFVKYQPQVTYVPEFTFYNEDTGEPISPEFVSKLKSQKEIEQLKAQYALKDPLIKQQAMQQTSQTVFRPQKGGPLRYPLSQQKVIPLDMSNLKNEEFINFFHVGKQEEALPPRHNYKVEVVVPKNPRFKLKPDLQEKPSIHVDSLQIPEQLKHDERFNEELLKNYHLLKVQAEETLKKHKQKVHIYNNPTNRLPNGQIIGGQTRLQPAGGRKPQHAVTLQQRPLPPGMFRPPFLPPPIPKQQKRPTSQVVAAFHGATVAHRLNGGARLPQKFVKQELIKPEHPQYAELHKQFESLGEQFESEGLKLSTVLRGQQETVPLAVNTGFDPDSVKVEGGFKPILNTGIAPKFNVIDRADENVDEADDNGKIGVIDLTDEGVLGEKEALFKDGKQELIKVDDDNATEGLEKRLDLFKNQKPQMFEPIFVPSPPDNVHKYQEKHKKKPITKYHDISLKYRSDQLQYYNTNKNGNYRVKIRPRPNLIRRPLYPDSVVPPFKIPVRGGAPQFRQRQSEESREDATDFDIIAMNNDTSAPSGNKAENILEIIEMEESKANGTEVAQTEDELAMADNSGDYSLPATAAVAHNGEVVTVDSAPALPEKAALDVSKLPQVGLFMGEATPLGGPENPEPATKLEHDSELSDSGKIERDGKSARNKRSPDHVPGHVGPHDHDHDHHDHDQHDHDHHHHDSSAGLPAQSLFVPSFCLLLLLRLL